MFAKSESENPASSVYDELIDLDQEASGNPYDVADDGTWYHELKDLDKVTNETYDQPDAVPALPDRSTLNPYQDVNQETTKPNTNPVYLEPNATPVYLMPNITPVYLELIGVDEKKNQTAEC